MVALFARVAICPALFVRTVNGNASPTAELTAMRPVHKGAAVPLGTTSV
jgi:hypothetical protein